MRDQYDRSSKWLIQHHGDSLLRLAGIEGFQSWKPLQAEIVHPRQLPDGLLEARFTDEPEEDLFLIEIATYPEQRLIEQVVRDTVLVYAEHRRVPEVLTLILHPKGEFRVTGSHDLASRRGLAGLRVQWRVVELWTVPAKHLLAANDVGLIPWVPLTQFDAPPEAVLEECRHRIDRQASTTEHANLLAVTQVMAQLRYNDPGLLELIGGQKVMIESPLIQDIVAARLHRTILILLKDRFSSVPQDIVSALKTVRDDEKLDELNLWAAKCPDLESFRARL